MPVYPKEREKRQHRRLPAISLSAEIKIKKGLFTKWQTVRALDFNIYGVALIIPHEPELGSKTLIKLSLEMDMAEVKVNQLEAKVVNKVMLDSKTGEWRAGLIFSNQSKHTPETSKQLSRINDYLERNNLLKSKIKDDV
tara:strand:- start:233 stop:649 length:417 start_codon:yes stop_codon:yes gene_type:complete